MALQTAGRIGSGSPKLFCSSDTLQPTRHSVLKHRVQLQLVSIESQMHVCLRRNNRVSAVAAGDRTGAGSSSTPLLDPAEVMDRYRAAVHPTATATYRAMYSSITGGITTDPACMLIPMDDHMVHRGHGVFDTAAIAAGHLYELDPHLDRIMRSASNAKIKLPFPRDKMRQIIIDIAAASGVKRGHVRFWLSAGPGDFWMSPKDCPQSTFYAVAIEETRFSREGKRVVTSNLPIKPPEYATTKSVNYLPNVLLQLEAEEKGADVAIWLDQEGFIGEGPSMNVAFVSQEGVLLVPPFEKVLAGVTLQRVMKLATLLMESSSGKPLLTGVEQRPITVEEARQAAEMLLVGSGVLVSPVVQWDGRPVGAGKRGPVALKLREMIDEDMDGADETADRIRIPTN